MIKSRQSTIRIAQMLSGFFGMAKEIQRNSQL